MALTIAGATKKAALDGMTAVFNGGQFRLLAGATEVALLTFSNPAFPAAATPSGSNAATVTSSSITADNTVTSGTITAFDLRDSAGNSRISGTVSTIAAGTGDIQVTDTVVPGTATSVTCTGGLTITLQLT